ncbi:hypothetical protein AB4059_00610 [Lysobacter sp. 2RAF19]
MPFYQIMIHGSDLRLVTHGASRPIVGFYATKRVFASDPRLAQEFATAEVLGDWRAGGEFASGGLPTLTVESVVLVPVWRALLKRKPRGYTFYSEDPPEDGTDASGGEGGATAPATT